MDRWITHEQQNKHYILDSFSEANCKSYCSWDLGWCAKFRLEMNQRLVAGKLTRRARNAGRQADRRTGPRGASWSRTFRNNEETDLIQAHHALWAGGIVFEAEEIRITASTRKYKMRNKSEGKYAQPRHYHNSWKLVDKHIWTRHRLRSLEQGRRQDVFRFRGGLSFGCERYR